MLKVGKKRKKEREKEHKLDCLDLSSRFSARYFSLACLKLHHAVKETKYKIGFISEYYVTIKHATHRLYNKYFSRGFIK